MNITAVIRGGGDLGTGVACHLRRLGVRVVITELDCPKMVRHPVCLGYAVYNGVQRVEGLTARLMSLEEAKHCWERPSGGIWDDIIPVVVDRDGNACEVLRPAVVCDCRMLKLDVPDERSLAPVVVGLGPGFCASCRWSEGSQDSDNANVDCVVETQRGEHLGDIITSGRAIANTGVPGVIGGESRRRLLRAPQDGTFRALRRIGEIIEAGTVVGHVGDLPVISAIGGRLRGLVHDGLQVRSGEKIGDCDPRGVAVSAFRISDKSHAVGASVAAWLQSLPDAVQERMQRHEEMAHPAAFVVVGTTEISLANDIIAQMQGLGDARQAEHHLKFFKTAPGEYGAGDRFLGMTVPQVRAVSKQYAQVPLETVVALLQSEYHEVRLCALQILVQQFRRQKRSDRSGLVALYLALSSRVNNWDLVDLSVGILGEWLIDRERSLLFSLAHSDCMWCRRMAMVATQTLIKRGETEEALSIAALLLPEREDLLHKAVGWMLREVGKQDEALLKQFLRHHYDDMPRTALRYAIEKFPEEDRRAWLKGPAKADL